MDVKVNNDLSRNNKQVMNLFTIVTVVLFLAYLVQYIKGEKSLGVFIALTLTDLIPMIIGWIVYKINNDTIYIKHIVGIGYAIFYTVSCFTSYEQQVYVYAVPMIMVVVLYSDIPYSMMISIGVSLIAVIHAIWFAAREGFTSTAVAAMEIEIALMVLVSIFSVVVNRMITKENEEKINTINEAGEKTTKMLDEIMSVSGEIIDDVAVVSDKMTMLAASSEETLSAMQEIQSGTGDTAESVQNQLYKTEEIQTQINQVTGSAENIGENVNVTVDACHEGRENIEKLMEQVRISEQAGSEVMKQVDELKDATAKMQSIVELIQSVASQTSLLALNASIEAARAGEAGRGFAVVATEISNLAGQTQTATGNISELIESISKEMTEVVSSIDSLVESNKMQNESAHITQGSFEKIVESIRSIRENSTNLSEIVGKLASANEEIVESVQTISAITEEVSAHSNNTCEATENNEIIVEEVQLLVEGMTMKAEKLKALR